MSERALLYFDENLIHRMLVINEADGAAGEYLAYLLRSLLSEGRLTYHTVEKGPDGPRGKAIEREGPTGLILTTTAAALHPENENRMLSLVVNDTADQTSAILQALAREDFPDVAMGPWHALQGWLETGPRRVVVPFALTLAKMIPPSVVRLRRDFKSLLDLIRTSALLHQAHRERTTDGDIIATIGDYRIAHRLIADVISAAAEATVPARIRRAVEAVGTLEKTEVDGVSVRAVAKALGIDKGTASRACRDGAVAGWLANPAAGQRGVPARYRTTDPMPVEGSVLPSTRELAERCGVAVEGEVLTHTRPTAVGLGPAAPALRSLSAAEESDALQLAMSVLGTIVDVRSLVRDLRSSGTTWYGIAQKLNEDGVVPPDDHNEWNPASVATYWAGG